MRPRAWVALVGPAAAGKTTFAKELISLRPGFVHTSDLAALAELFALEAGDIAASSYWPEMSSAGMQHPIRTKRIPGGGYDILDPCVWDDALQRVVDRFRETPQLVLEFARGTDEAYLRHHALSPIDVYAPSFELLSETLQRPPITPFAIVHVATPFLVRMERNALRRAAGEHFVAEEVMRSIYTRDLLLEQRDAALDAAAALGTYVVDGTLRTKTAVGRFLEWWDSRAVRSER